MKTIETYSNEYRAIRKFWFKYSTSVTFKEWLQNNGIEIDTSPRGDVNWALDVLDVAPGVDLLLIADEKKFAWLLLQI